MLHRKTSHMRMSFELLNFIDMHGGQVINILAVNYTTIRHIGATWHEKVYCKMCGAELVADSIP